MARFLSFAVEETLQGNGEQLKEVVIGMKVFDRTSTYDPRLDPIVRVEARRLRSKLKSYYEEAGKHDNVLIHFPKGRYSPEFSERSAAPNNPSSGVTEATIAVLPFTNLHPGEEGQYFSDGLSEELVHALMRISNLRVVAWNSASQLRGRQEDFGTVRQQLDVAHILHGSVRWTGRRLRIGAHLINAATGHYVWSETYDRKIHDIFAIQEEIALSIATALELRFNPRSPTPDAPRKLESFQLYLKGRFHARERTVESLKRSLVCFEQSIAADGSSAAAYSGLADTYTLLADYGFADGCEYMAKAKTAVETALQLDPSSAEAHTSFGLILTEYDWAWERAAAEFQLALDLNPSYAQGRYWYGMDYLAMLGRFDEARIQVEAAIKLDPLSSILSIGPAFLHMLERKYDKAIEECQRIIEKDPSFYKAYTELGRAYLQNRMYPEAIDMLAKGRSLAGNVPSILGAMGKAHALMGDAAGARKLLGELKSIAAERPVPGTCFAMIHIGLGEPAAALTWLERGVARHQTPMIALNVHPAYDSLRQEPRFRALIQKIGFPS